MISLAGSEFCSTSTRPPAHRGTSTSAPAAAPAVPVTGRTPSTEAHQYGRPTRHWSQSFSRPADSTRSSSRGDVTDLQAATSAPPLDLGSTRPTTGRPTTTDRVLTATAVPSAHTAKVPLAIAPQSEEEERGSADGRQGGAGLFCVWLFASCLLLCLLSTTIILLTSSRLLFWYWKTYRPLKAALGRGGGGVRLPLSNQRGGRVGGSGEASLYRSVLFVHRDEENTDVYRRTMHRLLSREEELEGWRDVMEECRVSAREEGGCRAEGVCYSIILRQESQGGTEELEWVLGGWAAAPGSGARGGQALWWDRNAS